jgi:hypothetical protein
MNHNAQEMDTTKEECGRLLRSFYKVSTNNLPGQRQRSQWTLENKCGFLLGIVQYGMERDARRLHKYLVDNSRVNNAIAFTDIVQKTFIDEMFDFYIRPFKQHSGSGTSTPKSSNTSPRNKSVGDLDYELPPITHNQFREAVEKRDGACLFCWRVNSVEASHIIAQKASNIASYDEQSILARVGLKEIHEVQNGLLLCKICHSEFDKLKHYVEAANERLVVKVVNESVDGNDMKHLLWQDSFDLLFTIRTVMIRRFTDKREVTDSNGEMALYFAENNANSLPNRKALEFHKAACLIWRMAGGAELDTEEHCPDDDCSSSVYDPTLVKQWIDQTATMSN